MDNLFQERLHGFPAHIDRNSVVLILGTLPGQRSLSLGKYYANPSNRFWELLFLACGEKVEQSESAKETLLSKYHIALWDVLESAVRDTSSDRNLMNENPNDLPRCLAEYSNIKLLIFHGNHTYKYFKRFFKNTAIPYICVSSPSGQNRKSTEEKVKEWRAASSCAIPQLQDVPRLEWKDPTSV